MVTRLLIATAVLIGALGAVVPDEALTEVFGIGGAILVPTVVAAFLLRRRDRDRPMRWLPAIVWRDGTAPGLVAPHSPIEAGLSRLSGLLLGGYLLAVAGAAVRDGLTDGGGWTTWGLAVGGLLVGGWQVVELSEPDRIAIVADGVLVGQRLIPWAQIRAVRKREGGLMLIARPEDVPLDPRGSMIDPDELRVAVETYLKAPERRAELNSPVDPRGAVAQPERQAVEDDAKP